MCNANCNVELLYSFFPEQSIYGLLVRGLGGISEMQSDFKRVVSSTGVYAGASIARRGLAFFLLPVYTYFISPEEYGALTLLNAFSTVVFACLLMGLPSAIMKCYHRDCETDEERSSVWVTAVALGLPVLLLGGGLLFAFAGHLSRWLVGPEVEVVLLRLVIAGGVLSGMSAHILASLRAEERALTFSLLSLTQFTSAMLLNILLVVRYELGIHGVLWGQLGANLVTLLLGLLVVRRRGKLSVNRRLAAPLLRFGLLLIPSALASWVMGLSDRYVLSLYGAFDEVAVYAVGAKIAATLGLVVVGPFQLAWPAVSFDISKREGHRETYARTLTYLMVALIAGGLALSILSRVVMLVLVGEGYRDAYRVVPIVVLASACGGIHFCISPGIHIAGKSRYLPWIAAAAAGINLGLNFLLIPHWGMIGASWATVGASFLMVLGTFWVAQRFYPVRYEYLRLVKLVLLGLVIFLVAVQVQPDLSVQSVASHLVLGLVAFPVALASIRFFDEEERLALRDVLRRPFVRR